MGDTREEILLTALHLFARDGYEAVSVSTIAGALGMTKGALYKHYKNKRDIFDHIVQRMYEIDAARSQEYAVPDAPSGDAPESYAAVSWDSFAAFTLAQFTFWTEDGFARDFRRMLTLEQYRSAEIAELYRNCIVSGPARYTADIFREMQREGRLSGGDPETLALAFCAPLFLLLAESDCTGDPDAARALLERHIDEFYRCYIRKEKSE